MNGDQYFVLCISPNGVPNEMKGPGTWDACVAFITDMVKDTDDLLTNDGIYEQDDGSTYYIVSASPFAKPEPETVAEMKVAEYVGAVMETLEGGPGVPCSKLYPDAFYPAAEECFRQGLSVDDAAEKLAEDFDGQF